MDQEDSILNQFQKEEKKIKGIEFSDLYIASGDCWMCGVPGSIADPVSVGSEYHSEIDELRKVCSNYREKNQVDEFPIVHDDICYRVALMPSMKGDVFVLRRFPSVVPDIQNLGIHPVIVEKLLTKDLKGMILIAGATGSGKTTTASSLIVARLKKHGGIAVTAEDPPEMPLEGKYNNPADANRVVSDQRVGVCYQTTVPKVENGYAESAKKMLRWNPDIMFLGEIRDGLSAVEALKAGINGHLVISTIHSESVITALNRIYTFAAAASESAASLMADGVICVLHQVLEEDANGNKSQLTTSQLFIDERSSGVKSIIRDKRFEMLSSEIMLQRNKLMFKGNQE